MILEWMAYAALCAALVGLAAWCADSVFAAFRRARRVVWIAAIATSTISPFALPLRPHSALTAAQPAAAHESESVTAGTAPGAPSPSRTDVVILSLWAAASAAFAVILLVAHRRTTSALERCRRATVAGSPAFVSNDFGPAVVGVLRRHVVVPAWTLGLSAGEQHLVVAHELEHARSKDPILALAGVCAVVVMPWNVALWWQLSRLRLAIELDCDARVVARTTGGAVAYSRLLIAVSERALTTRQPVLAMSRSRSALAKRFDALLSTNTVGRRRALALSGLAAGIVASVAFVPSPNLSDVVGAIRLQQRSAPVNRVVAVPTNRATFTPAITSQPVAGIVQRRTPRITTARPQNRLPAIGNVDALPPVSVVPSTQRGPLDSVLVASAKLPPISLRRGGAVIRATPVGGGGGGGGFSASSRPIDPPADSNRVIRGGRGGRATLVARPDTSSSR